MDVLRVDNETHKVVLELTYDEAVKLSNAFAEKTRTKESSTEQDLLLRWQLAHLHSFMKEKGDKTGLIINIYNSLFGKPKRKK